MGRTGNSFSRENIEEMRYRIIIAGVCVAAVAVLAFLLRKERERTARLEKNQRTLMEDVRYYRSKDSLSAAGVERLLLTNREFRKYCGELKETVDRLGIKVKRLESVSLAGTETSYRVETRLRDSVVVRDSLVLLKCMRVSTPYLDVSGCLDGEVFSGTVVSRDTLEQVVHRVPHKFWFFKWGTKAIRQEIVSKNPHSRITYSKYVELKK